MIVPQGGLRLRFWLAAVCLQAPKPGAIPNFAKPGDMALHWKALCDRRTKPPACCIIHKTHGKCNQKMQKCPDAVFLDGQVVYLL